jgi:hypothetical protein
LALWSETILPGGGSAEKLLVRKGISTVGSNIVVGFDAFKATPFVSGQARTHLAAGTVTFQALLADGKTQAIVDAYTTGTSPLTSLAATRTPLEIPQWQGAQWINLGTPANNASLTALTFLGTIQTTATTANPVKGKAAKVAISKSQGIFLSGSAFSPLALTGGSTLAIVSNGPSVKNSYSTNDVWHFLLPNGSAAASASNGTRLTNVLFTGFGDPVISEDADSVAFLANIKGTGIGSSNNTGLWWTGTSGTLVLVAQTGTPSNGLFALPKSTVIKSFTSVALPPGGKGPMFTTTLSGAGNHTALWAVDSNGELQLLAQTGTSYSVNGQSKTLERLDVINAGTPSSTPGVTRSFNASAVTYRATFKDKSQAVVTIYLP